MNTRAAVAVLILITVRQSRSQTIAETVSSGSDSVTIQASYAASKAAKQSLARQQLIHCGSENKLSCVSLAPRTQAFLYPVPALFNPSGEQQWSLGIPKTSWAPLSSVFEGSGLLDSLLRSVSLGEAIGCDDYGCRMAVFAKDAEGGSLAVCTTQKIGQTVGPPKDCTVAGKKIGDAWWLRVIDQATQPDPPRIASIYKLEIRGLPRSVILTALDRELAAAPLAMSERQVKNDRILALASKRYSSILRGAWFEWPQILVEVDDIFQIDISLDLLVNKQNTSDPTDWHLPTEQQTDEYRKVVAAAVTKALGAICFQPKWTGSATLECGSVKTSDGAVVKIPESIRFGDKRNLDPRISFKQ